MAFCIRSERNTDLKDKDNYPGPGQYIKISSVNKINNKRKFPPFFTSSKRPSFVKSNDTPGPGSYYLNKEYIQSSIQTNAQMLSTNSSNDKEENNFQELITNFNSGEKNTSLSSAYLFSNQSISSKLNNISTKSKNNFSKDKAVQKSHILKINSTYFNNKKFYGANIGFLSQANRFNEQKNENEIPGPGYYYESILSANSRAEKKLKNKLKKGKIYDKMERLNRIISIPSKTMNGYVFENTENYKNKTTNNSIKKYSDNYFNNTNNSPVNSKNKNENKKIESYSESTLNAYNKKLKPKDENKIYNNKYKLLLNERKFGYTTNTTTSEFVGPGTYDIFLKEKNNIVSWSKGYDFEKISKKNNYIKKAELLEEMKRNGDNIPLKKIDKKINNFKLNKNMILLLFNLHKIKNNILHNKLPYSSRSNFIPDKSEIPGPGYYGKDISPINYSRNSKLLNYDDESFINSKKTPNLNYIKYYFGKNKINPGFGSHSEREMNKSKTLEDLGPFSYFKDKNKFDPGKKNTLYKNIILGKTDMSRTFYQNFDFYFPNTTRENKENEDINNSEHINKNKKAENLKLKKTTNNLNSKSEKHLIKKFDITSQNFFSKLFKIPLIQLDKYKYNNDSPGPGDYNLSHKFIKNSFSSNELMHSKTERFKDKIINENPGPGAYQLQTNKEKKNLIKKIAFKKLSINSAKEERIKKIIENNKKRNKTPGVGLYNLDKNNSLIYRINSKRNYIQGNFSPFLISTSRFNRNKEINKISSGDYDPYKFENNHKNNQFMVFNKAERFNKENDFIVGPGSYQLNTQWNKRSYNKLFYSRNELYI